jgi:hypothetical protein
MNSIYGLGRRNGFHLACRVAGLKNLDRTWQAQFERTAAFILVVYRELDCLNCGVTRWLLILCFNAIQKPEQIISHVRWGKAKTVKRSFAAY